MAQTSEKLAAKVRSAMEARGMSSRDIARAANGRISHMTICEMARGVVPSLNKLATFALVIGEHPDCYLEAAGEPFRYVGSLDSSAGK